jgi:hypothetical protein
MNVEQAATNVCKMRDYYDGSSMFRVTCDCMSTDCDHVINVEYDEDIGDVTVTIYATQKTRYWDGSRFKWIWKMLTKGYVDVESSTVLNKQAALNYAGALTGAVDKLEEVRNQDG